MRILNEELSVYVLKFLCLLTKVGHWETEKAKYKNATFRRYIIRVTRPALILFRRCVLHRNNVFVCTYL